MDRETVDEDGQGEDQKLWSGRRSGVMVRVGLVNMVRETISSYLATGDSEEEAAEAETTINGGGAKTSAKSKSRAGREQEKSKKRGVKEQ
jgi:hypothetical protein